MIDHDKIRAAFKHSPTTVQAAALAAVILSTTEKLAPPNQILSEALEMILLYLMDDYKTELKVLKA